MRDECLICGAPLRYLDRSVQMECELCHRKVESKAVCERGHFVCDECHANGVDAIVSICLAETSKDPIAIVRKLMALPGCHMHGPEHHVMVGSALLTAYRNAGGAIDLNAALLEMQTRGGKVPGGACGFWGACGAGISAGMFVAIVTGSTPLKNEEWSLSNRMTAEALANISKPGGPRCCKRNSYTAILTAARYAAEHFGVKMEVGEVRCIHSEKNNQCIKERCPYQ